MTIRFRQFDVPGVKIADLAKHLGSSVVTVKKVCAQLGIELFELKPRKLQPLSNEQAYRVIAHFRARQGQKLLRKIDVSK